MRNRDATDKGRVKFRVVEFEVEGGNAAVQEGLRSIAAAIARSAGVSEPQSSFRPV